VWTPTIRSPMSALAPLAFTTELAPTNTTCGAPRAIPLREREGPSTGRIESKPPALKVLAAKRTRVLRRRLARREQLVRARMRCKNEVHAVLMRRLVGRCPFSDLFRQAGRGWSRALELPMEECETIAAAMHQIEFLDTEITEVERLIAQQTLSSPGRSHRAGEHQRVRWRVQVRPRAIRSSSSPPSRPACPHPSQPSSPSILAEIAMISRPLAGGIVSSISSRKRIRSRLSQLAWLGVNTNRQCGCARSHALRASGAGGVGGRLSRHSITHRKPPRSRCRHGFVRCSLIARPRAPQPERLAHLLRQPRREPVRRVAGAHRRDRVGDRVVQAPPRSRGEIGLSCRSGGESGARFRGIGILCRQLLRHGHFDTPQDLAEQMLAYIETRNQTATPAPFRRSR
jgi:hypothetical protein